jgi:co-chaperonin GroES (HSP10)
MKNLFFIVFLLLIANGFSQEVCSVYYPLQKGTSFQITSYEKVNKPTAVVDYEVSDAGADWAMLAYEVKDKKGEVIANSEYEIRCQDDGIAIDFKSLGAPGIMEQYKDMEIEVSGTNLIIPNELLEGRELPDSNMHMTIHVNPIKLNMDVNITNRKVSGKETITTQAGTFECVVLSYNFETKMGIKISGTAKQWLAEGVGMVKQEDYNKKGKLMSWSELTAFSK